MSKTEQGIHRTPRSLYSRALLATSIALFLTMSLLGWGQYRAYKNSLMIALDQRLHSYVYALVAVTDVDTTGQITIESELPEPRLSELSSGLCAKLINTSTKKIWVSPSCIEDLETIPDRIKVGEERFQLNEQEYTLSVGLAWVLDDESEIAITIMVTEQADGFRDQLMIYQRTLLIWLFIAAIVLLIVQVSVLRWSLSPLRHVADEVHEVERGRIERIVSQYPPELDILTRQINRLIDRGQQQMTRYRNALGDLAHSLKTPIAILKTLNQESPGKVDANKLEQQLVRMETTIRYQLNRAVQQAERPIGLSCHIEATIKPLTQALEKLFSYKEVAYHVDIEAGCSFPGDCGDLQEIAGNLLENAGKYGNSRVFFKAKHNNDQLLICVEDDGPGLDAETFEQLLSRGKRGDERQPGQGIGLSVVSDLIHAYQGNIRVKSQQPFIIEVNIPL